MKRFVVLFVLLMVSLSLFALGSSEGSTDLMSSNFTSSANNGKVLVAYFSQTGNTHKLASRIAELTGGDLYDIVPAVPYTDEDLDYNSKESRSYLESKDKNARPELMDYYANFNYYSTVILCYPIWYGEAPKVIYSFLDAHKDLASKKIAAVCTSASSGLG
ncbi:MAG: aldo/keto reductase, partial [Spirochaetales bacterium]|nr:aldo/keto reductase [Candidatus Physcosoma equi]